MDIVSCTDTNFVIPLGVMIHSLCVNDSGNELHFHIIIDDTVTLEQQHELRSVVRDYGDVNFYLINVDNIKEYLIVKVENFPIPIYYRLLMDKILPNTIKKVLYLDADIIVRKDLSELWNTSLENLAVAGVPNASYSEQCYRLNYPEEKGYFNSGVLLFNLDYIRKHNITDLYITYIIENPEKLLCPDQDVINYVLQDCKIPIPVRYNVQEGFLRIPPANNSIKDIHFEEEIIDPVIVHYTKDKPWSKKCNHPLKNLYYHYKNSTIWSKSMYMEHFKYKKLDVPFIIQLKLLVYNFLSILGFYKKEKIQYRQMDLEK